MAWLSFIELDKVVVHVSKLPRIYSKIYFFSSKIFIISGLTFKSLIHFELIFCELCISTQFYSFAGGYIAFPTSFIDEAVILH